MITGSQKKPVHAVVGSTRRHGNDAFEGHESSAQSFTATLALLTGGGDKPYALGLAEALTSAGVCLDFIGSDDLDVPELHCNPRLRCLNLRGDQKPGAGSVRKMSRIVIYYLRLFFYITTSAPRTIHILWNNKFQVFDRTLLMLFYKLIGKKIVFTAHNVNAGKRDGNDSLLNRLTLKIQYSLSDHIFVHTEVMKTELNMDFSVPNDKISVIPFGINNTVPNTALTVNDARKMLGIKPGDRTLLFFGRIAPYKGLEYLISALAALSQKKIKFRLIIAGHVKQLTPVGTSKTSCNGYWDGILENIARHGLDEQIIKRIEFIPDEETELYFKAADVLILPYADIFQSGVLFLGYSFGLPVIATDVGSLKEEIIEGKTGFVCPPKDPPALASAIETYFSSELYASLGNRRREIQEYANDRHSWTKVAAITTDVYSKLAKPKGCVPAVVTCGSDRAF
jgi:D-inositol-3-phosphate glycosyltransferase